MRTIAIYAEYWVVRLLYLLLVLVLVYGCYCYSQPNFTIGGHILHNEFYNDNVALPMWLYYLEYSIFVLVILGGLMLLITIYYALEKKRKEKIFRININRDMDYLLAELYREGGLTEEDIRRKSFELRKLMKNDFAREHLTGILRLIHRQTSGKARMDTELMMEALYCEGFIRRYLRSPYYRHKKIALNLIAEFRLQGYEKQVMKLARQKRDTLLHSDALAVLSRLNMREILLKLIEKKVTLSLWDVNVFIKNIEQDKVRNIPYAELLSTDNGGMVLLGIMLARLHGRKEFKQEMRRFTLHKNSTIKEEAVMALAAFVETQEDFEYLQGVYGLATEKAREEIIKAFKSCPDRERAMRFLEWITVNEPLIHKLNALQVILTMDVNRVIALQKREDPMIKMACAQVLDINI